VFQGDILNRKDCQRVGIRPEGVGKVLKNVILHEERLASGARQIQAIPHGLRREVEDRRPLADELDHRLAIHQRRDAIQSIRRDRESVDGTAGEVALIEEHSRLDPELVEEGFLDRALMHDLPLDRFFESDRVRVGEGVRAIHNDGEKAITTLAKPLAERVGEGGVDEYSNLARSAPTILDNRDRGIARRKVLLKRGFCACCAVKDAKVRVDDVAAEAASGAIRLGHRRTRANEADIILSVRSAAFERRDNDLARERVLRGALRRSHVGHECDRRHGLELLQPLYCTVDVGRRHPLLVDRTRAGDRSNVMSHVVGGNVGPICPVFETGVVRRRR
jgi:hypothetical protein